jgi:hypothetical protein
MKIVVLLVFSCRYGSEIFAIIDLLIFFFVIIDRVNIADLLIDVGKIGENVAISQ